MDQVEHMLYTASNPMIVAMRPLSINCLTSDYVFSMGLTRIFVADRPYRVRV